MPEEPTVKKRVDESWKEQTEREKQQPAAAPSQGPQAAAQGASAQPEALEARFDLFISGLAMEALIALGDLAHPATKRQAANLPQAKYLIDVLGIISDKTKGNLSMDEERLVKDALYQLRMRYLTKTGGGNPA